MAPFPCDSRVEKLWLTPIRPTKPLQESLLTHILGVWGCAEWWLGIEGERGERTTEPCMPDGDGCRAEQRSSKGRQGAQPWDMRVHVVSFRMERGTLWNGDLWVETWSHPGNRMGTTKTLRLWRVSLSLRKESEGGGEVWEDRVWEEVGQGLHVLGPVHFPGFLAG